MSGKVPPSTLVRARVALAVSRAKKLYRNFTGLEPESVQSVKLHLPDAAMVIGECDEVWYTTIRDDGGVKQQRYRHRFKRSSRPLLCVSADGKTLLVLGGDYEFTERGIEDR